MTALQRLPARLRLTLGFAVAMAALFAALGAGVYATMSAALLDELDTGLRARAASIGADLADPGFRLGTPPRGLLEPTEEFVQILSRDGAVIDTTPGIATVTLPAPIAGSVTAPRFLQRTVPEVGTARILAMQTSKGPTSVVLVVGASTSDRDDALHLMTGFLWFGGPVALLLASGIGWLLAGAALNPVERMRRQASAISASGLERGLSLPKANDEFRRLAKTLNEMLSGLDDSMRSERRFLDNASHELRTPLTAMKAELDIALLHPRTPEDLLAALHSASEETDRLCAMADDLLVLSRADGRLPTLPTNASLRVVLSASARLFEIRAVSAGVHIDVQAPDTHVLVDHARVRQAVDNLLDNAIRFAPPGTTVTLTAELVGSGICITVADEGPGFRPEFRDRAFDPFQRDASPTRNGAQEEGSGLGLAIVRAVVKGQGGTVSIESGIGGGTRVIINLPRVLHGEPEA